MVYYFFGLIIAADSHIIYISPYTIATDQKSESNTELDFRGYFMTNSTNSKFNPIRVVKTSNHLEIFSFFTLGDINIVIHDEQGNFVHHSNVNTITGNKLFINICNLSKGEYTIKCTCLRSKRFIYSHFGV